MKGTIEVVKEFKKAVDQVEKKKAEEMAFIKKNYIVNSESFNKAVAEVEKEYKANIEGFRTEAMEKANADIKKDKDAIYSIVSAPLPAGVNDLLDHYNEMTATERRIVADQYKGNYMAEKLIADKTNAVFVPVDKLVKDVEDAEADLDDFFNLKYGAESYSFINMASGFPLKQLAEDVEAFTNTYKTA